MPACAVMSRNSICWAETVEIANANSAIVAKGLFQLRKEPRSLALLGMTSVEAVSKIQPAMAAEADFGLAILLTRLKPCPDTKLRIIPEIIWRKISSLPIISRSQPWRFGQPSFAWERQVG